MKRKFRRVARDARTGRFATMKKALRHPGRYVIHRIPIHPKES